MTHVPSLYTYERENYTGMPIELYAYPSLVFFKMKPHTLLQLRGVLWCSCSEAERYLWRTRTAGRRGQTKSQSSPHLTRGAGEWRHLPLGVTAVFDQWPYRGQSKTTRHCDTGVNQRYRMRALLLDWEGGVCTGSVRGLKMKYLSVGGKIWNSFPGVVRYTWQGPEACTPLCTANVLRCHTPLVRTMRCF